MALGRPEATSHADIEQAAFRIFAQRGFEATTLDAIAESVGVGRRTLFRYYPSKNDIPWGQFDSTLEHFRETLDSMPPEIPLHQAVHRGILAFNSFPEDAQPPHLERMRLILQTPALKAHSAIRFTQWRQVIADFVASRTATAPHNALPQVVGHVSLALALTAYEQWLMRPDDSLHHLIDESMDLLTDYLHQ
ncbi:MULTISPECIES: mycofactocin system transcriptional regulator [Paenarthrobacter]|uniref:Mycofactocin system transcriptional regulator n=1 Tax=Paenarthrobacter aromaticivorans TaxID=2849150 RepID=A0ABS6ICB5_9MICC|nr:mycofactocin system transcriptional regulator [Paenarthrobacter sp. MMS21-TAE1-1]MBU8868508.1 mycofactocin system transcriptional regulator [Paenarthrobacter sp. MMS21-TAE1-1]